MPEIVLAGCTPEPLMSYLKALGVFRLVAEQADAKARGAWRGNAFVLECDLDRDALEQFFLQKYRPTPVLAPWNGGSGFYGGGAEPLNAVKNSSSARFTLYRETIASIRRFVPEGSKDKVKDEQKDSLLILCRAELPDDILPWLDCCFVLGEDRPNYFPLLGTGGNDGRLDFTNNFLQRVAEVVALTEGSDPPAQSADWLASALFLDNLVALGRAAIGQFNPGGIGGANGVQGRFEADSRVNPWDFVLMIEGALLFAGSVARRLSTTAATRSTFPFTVESVAVGYGSAAAIEETTDGSRAELWLPLWRAPAAFSELKQLFAEGRAQLGRQQARNAVEFSLAVNLLGTSRGINAFIRYGFLKRNGLAFLAAPLGFMPVRPRPLARLLDDPPLTEWLDRLRSACRDKDKTPARYQTALRNIDRAMFRFATRSESGDAADRRALVDVLRALGRAERTLAGGLSFCKDKYLRPLQRLSYQWLDQADDFSPEFRLAASLAGIQGSREVGPLRAFLEEVEIKGDYANWSPGSTSAVWSNRDLVTNLVAVFNRRQVEAFRDGQAGIPLPTPRPACLADIIAFLQGDTDDDKLSDLLWVLTALEWSAVEYRLPEPQGIDIPFEFGVPRLLVQPRSVTVSGGRWRIGDEADKTAVPASAVFHALSSGQLGSVGQCVNHAARRLKSSGVILTGYRNRYQAGRSLAVTSPIPSTRLLAAMLFPLADRDLNEIANAVLYPPENEE